MEFRFRIRPRSRFEWFLSCFGMTLCVLAVLLVFGGEVRAAAVILIGTAGLLAMQEMTFH